MVQPGPTVRPTMQVDALDAITIERLHSKGFVSLLPLVSRTLRSPAEAEKAVVDLLARLRVSGPVPEVVATTSVLPQVAVPCRPNDLAVAEGFLDLFTVALAFAQNEQQQALILSAGQLVADLRGRMLNGRHPAVESTLN